MTIRWWLALGACLVLALCGRVAVAHEEKDPVCEMMVDPHATEHRHDHAGKTYYF